MVKRVKISVDGAFIKSKGDNLVVKPRRLAMILAGLLIGGFGVVAIAVSVGGLIDPPENTAIDFTSIITGLVIGVGLLGVAVYAFRQGTQQKTIFFNRQAGTVMIDHDATINYDDVAGVFIKRVGRARMAGKTSAIIATGIVRRNDELVHLAQISKNTSSQAITHAQAVITAYAMQFGYGDLNAISDTNMLLAGTSSNIPIILRFESPT